MTKLQKIGLIMAIISAVLWLIWLLIWWYSSFGNMQTWWVYILNGQVIEYSIETTHDVNYIIYYALIVIFAVGVGLILEECSRKSLKKSLIVLFVSCLFWWLFYSLWIRYFATLCGWCTDYIGYGFWILFLIFLMLWFISCFFAIKYLTNNKKKSIIITLIVLGLVCVLFAWFLGVSDDLWRGLSNSFKAIFLLFFIVSVVIWIMAWIRRYKEAKKSS